MKRLLLLLLPLSLLALPAQVILIRNAEHTPDSDALCLKGRERATALNPFFQGTPSVLFYGLPIAIFAVDACKETVISLSDAINVPISEAFSSPKTLARELLTNPDYEGKMVLVCQPHDQMVELATRLGAKKVPKKWVKDSFDRLWVITFDEQGKVVFNDLPQKLLYGDSEK
jgi:hypothetical protein